MEFYPWNFSWDRDKEIQSQRNINYQLATGGFKKIFWKQNLESYRQQKGKENDHCKNFAGAKRWYVLAKTLNSKKNGDLGPKWQGLIIPDIHFLDSREPSLSKFNNESQHKLFTETF